MKARRTKSLYSAKSAAITPEPTFRYQVKSAQIASLESRLNGQQKRIAAMEAFIEVLRDAVAGKPLKPTETLAIGYENRIPTMLPHEKDN